MPFPKTLDPDNATFLRDLAEAIDEASFDPAALDVAWRVSDRLYAVANEVDALGRGAEGDASRYRNALEGAAYDLRAAYKAVRRARGER